MLTETETRLLSVLLMVTMFGIGASLTVKDFTATLRKPCDILAGLLCQYGIMPLLAFTLAHALSLPPALALGLIVMGCMPGGVTSNIFAYFSRGVLSLSVLLTVCSTLLAIVMVPLALKIYSSGLDGNWMIPTRDIIQILAALLMPTVLGVTLRRINANAAAVAELIGGLFSLIVVVFLLVTWVPRNWHLLAIAGSDAYLAAIGLSVFGFGLGYALSRALGRDKRRARTIALETGIQNAPLGMLIIVLSFSGVQQQQVLLIPLLYTLFAVMTSTLVTIWFRHLNLREEQTRNRVKIGMAMDKS